MTARPSRDDAPDEGVGALLAGSVGFLLSKLGFLSASRFSDALAPIDLTPAHFALLRYIDAARGLSQHKLGKALGIPASRIVALVDDLEARHLVERRRDAADRRVNTLHLTDKGQATLKRAQVIALGWENTLCAALEPAERAELLRLLRLLAADHHLPIGVHPGLAAPDES